MKNDLANEILRDLLVEDWQESGLSQRRWVMERLGRYTNTSMLLNGSRGYSLTMAIELANGCNIDLGRVQMEVERLEYGTRH